MSSSRYQVLIVGGGIQGCSVAQACAEAGYSTVVLEQNTWGSATSSRSSKLIHGGLRYLQTAQFRLVRECIVEREWMLAKMPALVKRNVFYIPIYRTSHYPAWQIFIGLSLYYAFTGFAKGGRFWKVPKRKWHTLTGLSPKDLLAVFAYQDAQTDDLALTQAVQQRAAELGAICLEKARFISATRKDAVYQVEVEVAGKQRCFEVDLIINASGPWINYVLKNIQPEPQRVDVEFIQGTHIVVEEQLSTHCFYLEAPTDRRAVFLLPWKGKSLIGTTETQFNGAPERSEPLQTEIDYLLATVQHYFPEQRFTMAEAWCGLRVLPKTESRAFSRPREVMLEIEPGLISVCGGKLTAWRATASKVLKEITHQLGG